MRRLFPETVGPTGNVKGHARIRWLEARKRPTAIAFFLLSAVILVPAILVSGNDLVQVFSGVVLVVHGLLSVVLFFRGLAAAALWATYYLLVVLGVLASLALERLVPLPEGFQGNLFTSVGIFFVTILAVGFQLPARIRHGIESRLAQPTPSGAVRGTSPGEAAGVPADETRDTGASASSGAPGDAPAAPSPPGVSYEDYIQQRARADYTDQPHALQNARPLLRTLRLVAGSLLGSVGLLGLLIGSNLEDSAATWADSPVFWLVAGSFVLIVSGVVIVLWGFLRALLVPTAGAVLVASAWVLHRTLQQSTVTPIEIAAPILAIAALVLAIVLQLGKTIHRRRRAFFTLFDRDGATLGTDLLLADVFPIQGYPWWVDVSIRLEESDNPAFLDTLNARVRSFCARRRFVLAGMALEPSGRAFRLFFYVREEQQLEAIRRFLDRHLHNAVQASIQRDETWGRYADTLCPNRVERIRIRNRAIVEMLETRGFDFASAVPVVFGLRVAGAERAMALADHAVRDGQDRALHLGSDGNPWKEGDPTDGTHYVLVQRSTRLALEALNAACLDLDRLAGEYGGEMESLTPGEISAAQPESA